MTSYATAQAQPRKHWALPKAIDPVRLTVGADVVRFDIGQLLMFTRRPSRHWELRRSRSRRRIRAVLVDDRPRIGYATVTAVDYAAGVLTVS